MGDTNGNPRRPASCRSRGRNPQKKHPVPNSPSSASFNHWISCGLFVCVCVRVWRLVIPLRCCPATGMAWKPYGKANPKRPGALDGPAGDVMDRLTVVRPRVTYMGIVMDSLYQHPTLQVTTRDFKVSKSHQRRPVGGSWYMYIIL